MTTSNFTGALSITPNPNTVARLAELRENLLLTQGVIPDSIPSPEKYGVSTAVLADITVLEIGPHQLNDKDTSYLIYDGKRTHGDDLKAAFAKLVKLVKKDGATVDGELVRTGTNDDSADKIVISNNKVTIIPGRKVILFDDNTSVALDS